VCVVRHWVHLIIVDHQDLHRVNFDERRHGLTKGLEEVNAQSRASVYGLEFE
jgi:hypothetical protein